MAGEGVAAAPAKEAPGSPMSPAAGVPAPPHHPDLAFYGGHWDGTVWVELEVFGGDAAGAAATRGEGATGSPDAALAAGAPASVRVFGMGPLLIGALGMAIAAAAGYAIGTSIGGTIWTYM